MSTISTTSSTLQPYRQNQSSTLRQTTSLRSNSVSSLTSKLSSRSRSPSTLVSPTFHERKAFPHLASFSRGRTNNSGPNGAPVVRTHGGSLVFPARRAGNTTWLKKYRRQKNQLPKVRRTDRTPGVDFVHEIDPKLLTSALSEVKTLTDFRHNVLFKPQRAVHLRSQIQVQEMEKRKRDDREAAKLANATNEDELSDFELLRVTLRDIRLHVEKLKVSGALDLRSFLGASLDSAEFQRLFRSQIGVKLEGRKLSVVMHHFDKDGDGNLDYIEVHSQLMNPHRLHVSDKESSTEDMLQVRWVFWFFCFFFLFFLSPRSNEKKLTFFFCFLFSFPRFPSFLLSHSHIHS